MLESDHYQQKLLVYVYRAGRLVILSFYSISLGDDANNSNSKTRLSLDMNIEQGMEWLKDFDPSTHGFLAPGDRAPVFPNGFGAWQQSHFEMVCKIQTGALRRGSLSYLRHEADGAGGLYQLATEMTDKFEQLYKGRTWDGDFYDTLEAFCESQNL